MKQMKNLSNNSLIESNYIKVSNIHKVYYEIHGSKEGIPVFIIHGGPGGGSTYILKELFDLNKFKLIFMDQRGVGKSLPFLELQENNTHTLVDDIEILRKHLKLNKIHLFGGSWGTTLALMYALKYPQNVSKILLRALFLGRQEDIDYLYEANGASDFYPDIFEEYKNFVNKYPGKSILEKYHYLFKNGTKHEQEEGARIFSNWERSLVSIRSFKPKKRLSKSDIDDNLAVAKMEVYYFINKCFFETDNYILENAKILKDIEIDIVHGRQDIDCRPIGAYLLHKQLPKSKLHLVDKAGHTSLDKNLWNTLKKVIKTW
ncbi:prolyl aminopeptidase [Mycoplasmopsis edwardii]|uniref:Prolyl aminopeptidase n=1 Tax=Mycoplasmopsis edwardii TaxID=53558 RepID=A0ACD4PH16_9BACT|nr:prolyl aminopeptidase [Mycoplasmopsis edwardii]WBP83964.1 prolyl aminopeptidase [Mycoplasmopsis edwardii]